MPLLLGSLVAVAHAQADDFTVIVLPDTQFYACTGGGSCAGDLGIFEAQTAWIAANRDALDIRFVTHVGDCVEHADDPDEFALADRAYQSIEAAGIPFGIAVGNHDQFPTSDPGSIPSLLDTQHPDQASTTTLFNDWFGLDRFCPAGMCRDYYGGHFGINNDNHYALFSAGDYDFVILHLEFMETDSTLRQAVTAWADDVLTRYSDRRAIVVSHYVLEDDSFTDQGADLYANLQHHDNLFLMLGGHDPGEGRRTDGNVHSLLADYQARTDGGEGYLRILEFQPSLDRISVRTYSPWLDDFETDSDSEFVLDYDLSAGFPDPHASLEQGTDTWVQPSSGPSGTDPSLSWSTDAAALIRFGGLFDTEGGPIPTGADITSAVLHTVVHEAGDDAEVHELLQPWTDDLVHADLGAYDAAVVAQAPGALGAHAIDVTASVAAWSDDPAANHGWILVGTGSDGASLHSSEAADSRDRPRLAVTWAGSGGGGGGGGSTVLLSNVDAAFVSAADPQQSFTHALEIDTSSVYKQAFVKPADLGGMAPGTVVSRADLVLQIVDPGHPVEVREVVEAWDPATLTFDDSPATGATVATFPGSPTGEVAVDVTALVQGWVDGAPAHGVSLVPTGGNGVDLQASPHFEVQVLDLGTCDDLDGDGHFDSACGGDDCDDADATSFPGAPEVCDDAVDHDCDGASDCPVAPRVVTLTAVRDAHVSDGSPATNLGGATSLEVDTASTFLQAFVAPADLGDIAPGAEVVRAELVVNVFNPGDDVEVREVLGGWDDATVTWNTAPATGAQVATLPGTTGEHAIDVTDLVQRWVDGTPLDGVNLFPTDNNGVDLYSADHADPALRPRFVVEVIDNPVPRTGDCPAVPVSVLVTDLQDAFVRSADPGTSFGSAPTLEVDTASIYKQAFLKPEHLGGIAPGAEVVRAELVLNVFDRGSPVEVREVVEAWDEGTVTFDNAPATGTLLATLSGDTGEVAVDVTALVQGWVDGAPLHGVSLVPTGTNGMDLYSTDHGDAGLRPYLVIDVLD